ncbi:MAG: flagellar hook-length control protein FliK, partial [Campylobacterales bacterium]|nr:flagellar hook-length control protein FliK [Campylobacterales bacterium]
SVKQEKSEDKKVAIEQVEVKSKESNTHSKINITEKQEQFFEAKNVQNVQIEEVKQTKEFKDIKNDMKKDEKSVDNSVKQNDTKSVKESQSKETKDEKKDNFEQKFTKIEPLEIKKEESKPLDALSKLIKDLENSNKRELQKDSFTEKKSVKLEDLASYFKSSKETKDDVKEGATQIKDDTKNIFSNQPQTNVDLNSKIGVARDSIRNFSSSLKEQVENYKPPIQKLSIEIQPANLGSVEVTLIQRGNNLSVNISSNQQAVSFLAQNGLEFKNSLNNLGFGDVQINYNFLGSQSQSQSGGQGFNQNQQQREKYTKAYKENLDEKELSLLDSIDIDFPKYI